MNHEKIIVRPDKTRYIISANLSIDAFRDEVNWSFGLYKIMPGKRKRIDALDTDSYEYRGFSMKDRRASVMNQLLSLITPEELLEAKRELWLKLEPK